MNREFKGFTLIEVMIAVLIIGILAAIAFPSYMSSVRKGNRAEAKAELTDVAQRLQRCYTSFGRFNHADCLVYSQLTTGTKIIVSRDRGFYEITIDETETNPQTEYTLTATAVLEPQTSDIQECQELTIDQRGEKLPADCWK